MNKTLTTGLSVDSLAPPTASRLLLLGIFLVALIPLFATPVLPFIDFYNHVARYFILANIDSSPLFQQNYRSNWTILPNVGLDVIVTGLMTVLPEAVVPRLTIILIFAVQYSGILFFNRALTGRTSPLVALLIVPLLYSFILNWGFANFLLGLGLVFWAAGWWLRQRRRLPVALPVACLLATAIFFVHGLAFALYGILIGMLEIGLWWRAPPRRLRPLLLAMPPLLAQAVVPVLLFLAAKTSQNPEGLTNADEAITRLSRQGQLADRLWALFQHRIVSIVRVAEGPSLAFDIATLLAMVALLLLLIRDRRVAIAGAAVPALFVFALLVVITPPAMFGVGYVADRMPLVLAMLFVGTLDISVGTSRVAGRVAAVMAIIIAVRLAGIALAWQPYAADKRDFDRIATVLPKGALVETIVVGGGRLDYSRRRCAMYGPLLVAEHGGVGRLFANEDQQPLVTTGPLRAAIDATSRPPRSGLAKPGYFDDLLANASRGTFPYVLLCDADRLTRTLPATLSPVAVVGRFTLLAAR